MSLTVIHGGGEAGGRVELQAAVRSPLGDNVWHLFNLRDDDVNASVDAAVDYREKLGRVGCVPSVLRVRVDGRMDIDLLAAG